MAALKWALYDGDWHDLWKLGKLLFCSRIGKPEWRWWYKYDKDEMILEKNSRKLVWDDEHTEKSVDSNSQINMIVEGRLRSKATRACFRAWEGRSVAGCVTISTPYCVDLKLPCLSLYTFVTTTSTQEDVRVDFFFKACVLNHVWTSMCTSIGLGVAVACGCE